MNTIIQNPLAKSILPFCLSIILGGLLAYTQAPTNFWFLLPVGFAGFYFIYQRLKNKKQVFAASFLWSVSYFVMGMNWIGNALLVEGNEYRWVWPLAVIALPMLLSLFCSLYLTINFILFRHHPLSRFLGFVFFITLSEWVRSNAFSGFPWNLYGYGFAGLDNIAQTLSLFGPFGLTVLTIGAASMPAYWFIKQAPYKVIISTIIIGLVMASGIWGYIRLQAANVTFYDDIEVHVIQPNIVQSDKWEPELFVKNFERHIELLQTPLDNRKKHIVVWPETAMPPALLQSVAVQERLELMLENKGILLTGALIAEPGSNGMRYYNSIVAIEGRNAFQLYSKSHLVPFGEYIPLQKYIPLKPVTEFTGFEEGNGPETIIVENYPSFSPQICYEIIFSGNAVNSQQPRPDYLLTVTNDGWYGDSAGPRQHFAQARFRAIEQGLPVIRSANIGISGIIDPYGRIVKSSPLMEVAAISGSLPHPLTQRTIYSKWGDNPFYLFMFFLFIACVLVCRLGKRANP